MNNVSILDLLLSRYMLPFYALGIIFTGIALENSKRRKQAKRVINDLIEHHSELLESAIRNNNVNLNENKELIDKLNKINGFVCYEIGTLEKGRIELTNMTLKEIIKKIPLAQEKLNHFLEEKQNLKLKTFDKIIDVFKIKDKNLLFICYSKYDFPFTNK